MSDDIIILDVYPNTDIKIEILKKCIYQLKKIDKEILIISHYPISIEIQQLVDYYIYDKRNELIYQNDYLKYIDKTTSKYWYGCQTFDFYSYTGNVYIHFFAIYQAMEVAFKFVKNLGKKYCYFMEGDSIISDLDLHQFNDIKDRVTLKNKVAYFQYNTNFVAYSTLFFFLNLDVFLNIFNFIKTKEEYITLYSPRFFLEAVMTKAFDSLHSTGLIEFDECINTQFKLFPNSLMNQSDSSEGTSDRFQKSDVVVDNNNDLIIMSICHINEDIQYFLSISNDVYNENLTYTMNGKNTHHWKQITNIFNDAIKNARIQLSIKKDDILYDVLDMKIDDIELIKKRGYIQWHPIT